MIARALADLENEQQDNLLEENKNRDMFAKRTLVEMENEEQENLEIEEEGEKQKRRLTLADFEKEQEDDLAKEERNDMKKREITGKEHIPGRSPFRRPNAYDSFSSNPSMSDGMISPVYNDFPSTVMPDERSWPRSGDPVRFYKGRYGGYQDPHGTSTSSNPGLMYDGSAYASFPRPTG